LTGQELLTLEGHKSQVNALTFSSDGFTLASVDHEGAVKLWRADRPKVDFPTSESPTSSQPTLRD
jgi:WD40 repeat protein